MNKYLWKDYGILFIYIIYFLYYKIGALILFKGFDI
jgi:hypothetical protein